MITFINGYKTYIVCLVAIIFALTSVYFGTMDWNTAMEYILTALGGAGLRHGVTKLE